MNKLSKLKKVSISLVLLSCFAVTSKMGAMNPFSVTSKMGAMDPDETSRLQLSKNFAYYKSSHKERQDYYRQWLAISLKIISKKGLQNEDIYWILDGITVNHCDDYYLNIDDLKNLIKYGLDKYVNYEVLREGNSLLTAAIDRQKQDQKLEIIKLLISVGAKIDKFALEAANKGIEAYLHILKIYSEAKHFTEKDHADIALYKETLIYAKEIQLFLLKEQERQAKAEIEKPKMGKNLLDKKTKKFCDTRIHLLAEQPE